MDKKELQKLFKLEFREKIVKPLEVIGFRLYRSSAVGRIVGDSVFQYISFQKDAYGSPKFTVNVVNRPLYIPTEFGPAEPGGRLGIFTVGHDVWWKYSNKEEVEQSFTEIYSDIIQFVIPWFEDMSSDQKLIEEYQANIRGDRWTVSKEWRSYGLGFIHLHAKQYEKAIELLQQAEATIGEYNNAHAYIKQAYLAIQGGDAMVEEFFRDWEKRVRPLYKLEKWQS